MVQKKIICNNLTDLRIAAKELLDFCENDRIFAFYGIMGAGKTTFIKAICEQLGVEDIAVSPSFSIVNVYKIRTKPSEPSPQHPVTIYHIDFFRIKNIYEVYDMGYEDYFYSNSYCFIEWPEKIETLLPPNYVKVIIEEKEADKNEKRHITIQRC
ncbi:MAG: tRNA (adenosine(37)-N6)-threonylcarbamoyltransferase complex ATPase subunit type 1 TsaE [Bacteroidota bacterium]